MTTATIAGNGNNLFEAHEAMGVDATGLAKLIVDRVLLVGDALMEAVRDFGHGVMRASAQLKVAYDTSAKKGFALLHKAFRMFRATEPGNEVDLALGRSRGSSDGAGSAGGGRSSGGRSSGGGQQARADSGAAKAGQTALARVIADKNAAKAGNAARPQQTQRAAPAATPKGPTGQ